MIYLLIAITIQLTFVAHAIEPNSTATVFSFEEMQYGSSLVLNTTDTKNCPNFYCQNPDFGPQLPPGVCALLYTTGQNAQQV